ncbi:MAG: mechanosensitive ion channel family protein [Pseudomonadota bacterium]
MDFIQGLIENVDWQGLSLNAGRFLLILVLGWIAMRGLRLVLGRVEKTLRDRLRPADPVQAAEGAKRIETLIRLLRQASTVVIGVVVLLLALREIGLDITPILASAGIVGLAIGFGAQNLVRDVITGFFMILEDQVRVGDVAIVNGTTGVVERVGLRTIVLRDGEGTVHTFPNGTISSLANKTTGWSGYLIDVGVGYGEDVDRVMAIMRETGMKMRADEQFGPLMIEDVEVFGLDNFADSALTFKLRLKTLPGKQVEVGREYRRRLKIAFDQAGVEIPYPQRVVHITHDPADAAPCPQAD